MGKRKNNMKIFGLFGLLSSAWAGGVCNFEDQRGFAGCPSTCQIYKEIEVVEKLIRGHWSKVKSNFEVNLDRSGDLNSSREILEQLLIRLQKIQKSSMSEAQKFQAYTKAYKDANVPAIIQDQESEPRNLRSAEPIFTLATFTTKLSSSSSRASA